MIIVYLLLVFSFILINHYKTKKSLHMLQQNLYNENNRYLKWVFKNNNFLDLDLLIVVLSLGMIVMKNKLEFVSTMICIIIILVNILLSSRWRRNIKNDQNKKKLVITARIKRLIFTHFL